MGKNGQTISSLKYKCDRCGRKVKALYLSKGNKKWLCRQCDTSVDNSFEDYDKKAIINL
jgi:DNA-directed RNA polymerase subunit RPC12/RpoP